MSPVRPLKLPTEHSVLVCVLCFPRTKAHGISQILRGGTWDSGKVKADMPGSAGQLSSRPSFYRQRRISTRFLQSHQSWASVWHSPWITSQLAPTFTLLPHYGFELFTLSLLASQFNCWEEEPRNFFLRTCYRFQNRKCSLSTSSSCIADKLVNFISSVF
jgi:hypothetical protein